ncbi:methyltransferase [Pelomicrobium sp. G1]|uniref:methyltransferase n=1 Tax=unclassified Pelomicrobium TaxID=2815318 RepID=UPI003F759499
MDLERHLVRESGSGRVLIPGCGLAYELRTFFEKGYEVVAIDFSVAAVERAKGLLGALQDAVVLGDFFSYDFGRRPFDLVYERAFLAYLPRRMWPDYAHRLGELLRPGGKLIGFFVYGEQQGGPPFCLKASELV